MSVNTSLDCDGMRAVLGLDAACCASCHTEATPGNGWGILRPLYEGTLSDGRRFSCCCEILAALACHDDSRKVRGETI